MVDLNNTYLIKNTVYSKGPSNCGYAFVKFFLQKKNNIKSFLDIGCGNGMLLKLMSKESIYFASLKEKFIKKRKIKR